MLAKETVIAILKNQGATHIYENKYEIIGYRPGAQSGYAYRHAFHGIGTGRKGYDFITWGWSHTITMHPEAQPV